MLGAGSVLCSGIQWRWPERDGSLATNMFEAASRCAVVLAEYNDPGGVLQVHQMLQQHKSDCRLKVYSKGGGGCNATVSNLDNVECHELPNRGREQHTFLQYTVDHYDSLPERIVFLPLPISKPPQRQAVLNDTDPLAQLAVTLRERAATLMRRAKHLATTSKRATELVNPESEGASFSCVSGGTLIGSTSCHSGDANPHCTHFTLARDKMPLLPATPSPLHAWVAAHLGPNEPLCSTRLCWLGASTTTGDNVRARPKDVYERLLAEFEKIEVDHDGEVSHYMERIAQLVFARPSVRDDVEWASGPEQGCK